MRDQSFSALNETGRGGAPAIGKAARILDTVSLSPHAPGISEIARSTGLSKSSVHGLVNALVNERLLAPVAGQRGFRLGARLADLGRTAQDQRLLDVAQAHLRDLGVATGETALFGRMTGDMVRILGVEQSPKPLNLSAPVGSLVPLMAGALGKAYLATLSRTAAGAFLALHPPRRFNDRSVTEADLYQNEIELARTRGYALDRGEYLRGIWAAASSFTWSGSPFFVWIVGIEAEHATADLERMGGVVCEAARAISHDLDAGYSDMSRSA